MKYLFFLPFTERLTDNAGNLPAIGGVSTLPEPWQRCMSIVEMHIQ
jgi:hypothetical protein